MDNKRGSFKWDHDWEYPFDIPGGKTIIIPTPRLDEGDVPKQRFIRWHTTDPRHLKGFKVPVRTK